MINGHKWFITNAALADFHIVMVRTEFGEDIRPHKAFSMILVPAARQAWTSSATSRPWPSRTSATTTTADTPR